MGFLRRLFGKPNKKPDRIEKPQHVIPANQNQGIDRKTHQEVINETGHFTFYVDGLQNKFKEFSQVGEPVSLWIPKVDDPDEVYIYHRGGPGGCLGFVPLEYFDTIISHLKKALEYEANIEELTENLCKIKCRLISKEETKHQIKKGEASLRKELTKAYNPKKPITLTLTTYKKDVAKAGDKLIIEFNDLNSYLKDVSAKRGPYSSQWHLKFLNQTGKTIAILDHDKSTIQKILKAHFNSYLFDIEVLDTFTHLDYSEEKKRSNWKGYPIKLVITPHKSSNTICS